MMTPVKTDTQKPIVISVVGRFVHENRHEVKQRVLDYLENGTRRIVVDFSDCGYIDSSGLGVLITCSQKVQAANGRFVLAALNEDLTQLLKLTQMDLLFTIADTVDRAIKNLTEESSTYVP